MWRRDTAVEAIGPQRCDGLEQLIDIFLRHLNPAYIVLSDLHNIVLLCILGTAMILYYRVAPGLQLSSTKAHDFGAMLLSRRSIFFCECCPVFGV
jgi:hypothetical protein